MAEVFRSRHARLNGDHATHDAPTRTLAAATPTIATRRATAVPTQPTVVQPPPQPRTARVDNRCQQRAARPSDTGRIRRRPIQPLAPASSGPVDAFINLGNGPYPLQNTITTGNAQPWYNSSQITSLFGGQPTAQQIQSFDNTVLQRVQQTFSQSGVSVTLTDNPNVAALHTLSLVSNTSSASLSSAIGMTQVGGSGFSFIDQIAPSAQSLDQLEWIVAHNISHELMLAFGVPENYDQTGNYIDSKLANWAMMVNPNSTFSPAAAQAITQALAAQNNGNSGYQLGAQVLGGESPVPEPTTVALWALARGRRRLTADPVAPQPSWADEELPLNEKMARSDDNRSPGRCPGDRPAVAGPSERLDCQFRHAASWQS